jgi:hypothetical protein
MSMMPKPLPPSSLTTPSSAHINNTVLIQTSACLTDEQLPSCEWGKKHMAESSPKVSPQKPPNDPKPQAGAFHESMERLENEFKVSSTHKCISADDARKIVNDLSWDTSNCHHLEIFEEFIHELDPPNSTYVQGEWLEEKLQLKPTAYPHQRSLV